MINRDDFNALIQSVAELYDREIGKTPIAIYWDLLREYSSQQINAAVRAHIGDPVRGQYFPKPADIIAKLPVRPEQQMLSADEAWAVAVDSFDESKTVVWTQAIADARQVASELWHAGETTAARMAFKAADEGLRVSTSNCFI